MVVLLYKSGIPVKLTEQFTELRYDIEGFLTEFTFQETPTIPPKTQLQPPIRYIFYSKSKFKTNDRKRTDLVDGYYNETQYLKYIENTGPNIPLVNDMIYTYKFNFGKFLAKSGDSISVNVTNFDAPYNLFFDKNKYDFIIEKTIDGKGVRSYAEGILDGFEAIDYKLRLPSIFTSSTLTVASQVNTAGYHFYAKNLCDFINNFTNNDDKRKLKKIAILIIFQIRYIIRDVFPDIMNNSTSEAILEAEAISNNTDLSGLSNLEQMLFLLKKSWGYYYDPNSTLPHKSSLPTMFNEQSTYADFEYYYIGLVSFYNETYVKQKALSTSSDSQKYDYLLSILPVNALSALPLEIIKKKILSLLDSKRNKEYREQYLARLVLAIAPAQANDFLDFLLEQENGVNTNFERLFNYLDDARIERIPVANWFTDEKTNRMAFVYAVHELWKVSKYSLQDAIGEVNEQSYFFTNGVTYYKNQNGLLKPVVLESGRLSSVSSGNPAIPLQTNTWVNYEADKTLKHELVTINKKINITNYYLSSSGNYLGSAPSLDTSDSIPSQYHLYQSLSLIGHQADDRTILPNDQPIPAFLFYYTEDFERILKIDAQIALAVNIGIEVVLFFTVGGITQLRHLQHLKHFTKVFRALNNELVASEEVLVWAGLEAGAQTTAISAATMYSLGQYNETILPTQAQRDAQAEANKVFLYIALVAAGGSVYCRYKAVTAAKQALIDGAGIVAMPEDVKAVMQTLVGESVNAVVSFETKLSTLPQLENANVIANRYASYTDDLKNAFYKDFGSIKNTETDFWNALNKTSTLDNWEELRLLDVLERNEISIITNTARTNAYVQFYSDDAIRQVLERTKFANRVLFLDTFGTQSDEWLEFLATNPQAINRWEKLDGAAKLFAKNKPDVWLFRFDRLYQNVEKLNRLSDAEILSRFGQEGLDLVNEVEAFALNHINTYIENINKLKKNDILISGLKDKKANITSDFFTNFSRKELADGDYDTYLENMFPNLKERIEDINAFDKKNYHMADGKYRNNTGPKPGSHAEVRALDDLAKKKFPDYLTNPPTDEVFDAWLKNDVIGYNRNIQHGLGQENVIMHTCAHCYHILDLVTFIRPN
jgi:hypothetical protein